MRFDRYIAIDWSASRTPKRGADSIWSCVASAADASLHTLNHPTRVGCETWLGDLLRAATGRGERVLVGIDFPYGYPAGLADALGLAGEPWSAVWHYLEREVRDDAGNRNNRFEIAAAINHQLGDHAPFWGRPAGLELPSLPMRKTVRYGDGGLAEWRRVERVLRAQGRRPQPAWKLAGAGAAGGQSLTGIPMLARLRFARDLAPISRVWPFESGLPARGPGIVHAEIWPSLVSLGGHEGTCRDERQVRAAADELRRQDRVDRLTAWFAAAPTAREVRTEGWVLGAVAP